MSLCILALLLAALALVSPIAALQESPPASCEDVSERMVLEALYFNTNGPYWTQGHGWLDDQDLCDWRGVYCNEEGQVMALWMEEFGMSGRLPVELGCLPHLELLSFENNQLVTQFIPEICQ
ncbi:hypothetical protein KIPB_013995, partial [Kipferlia bialata]|eukprot:g13995.t1